MIIHFGFRLIRVNHPMLPRITMLAYYLSSANQIVRKYFIIKIIMLFETIYFLDKV